MLILYGYYGYYNIWQVDSINVALDTLSVMVYEGVMEPIQQLIGAASSCES